MTMAQHVFPDDQPSTHGPLSLADAERYIELLTGRADTVMCWRFIHDHDRSADAIKADSAIRLIWPGIVAHQNEGFGVFAVVNEGGQSAREITRVRAMFIDADGIPFPLFWHQPPAFRVVRDELHWHAYWPVTDMPVEGFKEGQRRAAAFYGSDPAVCDLPRVMRVPGTYHLKDPAHPVLVKLSEADA
jgi:hypothetical protein